MNLKFELNPGILTRWLRNVVWAASVGLVGALIARALGFPVPMIYGGSTELAATAAVAAYLSTL